MTSSNIYKQSVFDNRSILISVSVIDDGSLNVKKCNRLLNNICQQFEVIKVQSSTNNEDDSSLKKIYFNFKRNYCDKEKEWEHFQLHHRVLGLLVIGEFKCGIDLNTILKEFNSEKEKWGGSSLESRLILIYDENTEDIVRNIRHNLSLDEEICSSDDTGDGNIIHSTSYDFDCELELSYIKDSLSQNDIIWYKKSMIGGFNTNSTCSLTDSVSSNCSPAWKISSHNSDNSFSSPLKSPSLQSDATNEYALKPLHSPESQQIYLFLKAIYDKLFTGLMNRESALTSKSEQIVSKTTNLESTSDSGSVVSLDDTDFNLSDPIDSDKKRFQDENRLSRATKSRHYLGRLAKQAGDYAMMCGHYWQSYHYYQLSVCYLRKVNDPLWLAGSEEGLCCAWTAFNFHDPLPTFDGHLVESLHAKCRLAFENQLKTSLNQPSTPDVLSPQSSSPNTNQIELSFMKKFTPDLFKAPPEIHSLDDLNEKYLSAISRYKKALKPKADSLHPINMDSCIKASRFFIDRHRYLDASNFLKLIKSDLINVDKDNEKYHNTMAKLYSQMGFTRKSIVHKYQTIVILQAKLDRVLCGPVPKSKLSANNALPKQKITEKKMGIVIEILAGLNVDVSLLVADTENVEDRTIPIVDNDRRQGFDALKLKMVSELFLTCKHLNFGVNTMAGLGLSILDNWFMLLTRMDCQRLIEDVNTFCRSDIHKANKLSKLCYVKNFPRLTKVSPTKLKDYLLPKQKAKPSDPKSIFIYTPLSVSNRLNRCLPPDPVVWICGEECELVLLFDNLLPVPLQLSVVEFLLSGSDQELWVSAECGSTHLLPSNSRNIHCHFVVIPSRDLIPAGEYRIANISYQILSIYNVTFYPARSVSVDVLQSLHTPIINIYPMMPLMKLFTSITEQNARSSNPPNTVFSSSIIVYDNEQFQFSVFLSNESKEMNIDRVTCFLDELELNSSSTALISRVADDEYNNRQRSTFRMLSLVQENVMKTLSIKSISSLKNATTTDNSSQSLPTDVTIKLRIDATSRELSKELFQQLSLSENDGDLVAPLWVGQFRLTFQYESDFDGRNKVDTVSSDSDVDDDVVVVKDDDSAESLYRESVCVLNCNLVLGLCLVGYRIERSLDFVITLMNFSENKMYVDIFWKGNKVNLTVIAIVPRCGQISEYSNSSPLKRLSSTECSSHIINYRINSEIMNLISLLDNGSTCSEDSLAKYIQSNLRVSWTMKDKSLDKMRQGNANLNWCICYFGQEISELESTDKTCIAHEIDFAISDIVKIMLWDNVRIDMYTFTQDEQTDSPVPPTSLGDDPISINVLDSVQYRITCNIRQENWSEGLSEEMFKMIILKCSITPTRLSHISDNSSEEDQIKFQHYEFAGNSLLKLSKASVESAELHGFVLFLVPGIYSMCSQLLIYNDQSAHYCHGTVDILAESNKYEIRVT